jgi:hypothetical protein
LTSSSSFTSSLGFLLEPFGGMGLCGKKHTEQPGKLRKMFDQRIKNYFE